MTQKYMAFKIYTTTANKEHKNKHEQKQNFAPLKT